MLKVNADEVVPFVMLSEVETSCRKSTFVCFGYAQHDKNAFTTERDFISILTRRAAFALLMKCVISSGEICLDKFRSREILLLSFVSDSVNGKISPLRSFLAPVEMTHFISVLVLLAAFVLRMKEEGGILY